MTGVLGYGSYVPLYRIERSRIADQYGSYAGGGETSVPAHDENPTTMAVEAAETALDLADESGPDLDAVYAATTSDGFAERGVAAHVAHAVGAPTDTRVSDFQGSARAATNAVLAARDALDAGRADTVLVTASDVLTADAGTSAEQTAGAGAGALVLGTGDSVAELTDYGIGSTGFVGRFTPNEDTPRPGDGRFNREQYIDAVRAATDSLATDQFDRATFPAHDDWGGTAASELDLDAQLTSTFDDVGYAAAGGVLLDLAATLDAANSDEQILVAGYGPGGCDALCIERTTDDTPDMTTDQYIQSGQQVPYGKHRQYRARGGE